MDPTLMEFYFGNLEDAVAEYARRNDSYSADRLAQAARAVITAWDEVKGA